jgi:2-polyprenyl-3-methyl-5-hydroxy-6-metoxy-1,4-benzoquinol methylase
MGTSHPENKDWVKEKIVQLNPKTILDIGAGNGTYYDLLKPVLDQDTIIDAVEIWQPYIDEFNLHSKYNNLYKTDVREFKNFGYDLVILGDVLEHMTEYDAVELWESISKMAKYAIISIPIIHYHQDAVNGNPYEVHVEEDWNTDRVLNKFKNIVEHKEFTQVGAFVGKFI